MIFQSVSISHKCKLPICLFLNIKVKTNFEVLLTCYIKEHCRNDVSHAIAKFVVKKSVLLHQNFQFFYLVFLSRTFTFHRTVGEGGEVSL